MREFGPVLTPDHAAKYISKGGHPITRRTMDNWRGLSVGPRFIRICGRIYYPVKFIEEWWDSQNPPEGYQGRKDYGKTAGARD